MVEVSRQAVIAHSTMGLGACIPLRGLELDRHYPIVAQKGILQPGVWTGISQAGDALLR